MQFSYEVSKSDYVAAWKVRCRGISRQNTPKLVLFWVFVVICLAMLWVVVQKSAHSTTGNEVEETQSAEPAHAPSAQSLVSNVGPFVLIGGVWVFLVFRMLPGRRLKKLYTNDPAIQGRFTVEVTSEGFAVENTAGFSSRTGWNLFESWVERGNLIVLTLRSQAYFILVLSQLAEGQREELRGLLSSALQKK